MTKTTIILDPGHGGVNTATGRYVTAGKRSRHEVDGSYFYEGEEMRKIAKEVQKVLEGNGYEVLFTVAPDDYRDVPLRERSLRANELSKGKDAVLISLHSNADSDASPQKGIARGMEVWTSPGTTNADWFAKFWQKEFQGLTGNSIKFRKGHGDDGFIDKEAAFHILTQTTCPAILIELGFHTNDEDVRMMRSWAFQTSVAVSILTAIQRYEIWKVQHR